MDEMFTYDCSICGARVLALGIRKHAEWHQAHGEECDPEDEAAWHG